MICDHCTRRLSCLAWQMGERSPKVTELLQNMKSCGLRQQNRDQTVSPSSAHIHSVRFSEFKQSLVRIFGSLVTVLKKREHPFR